MKMMGRFFAAIIAIFAMMVASAGAICYGAEQAEYLFIVCAVITLGAVAYTIYKFIKAGGLKWEN